MEQHRVTSTRLHASACMWIVLFLSAVISLAFRCSNVLLRKLKRSRDQSFELSSRLKSSASAITNFQSAIIKIARYSSLKFLRFVAFICARDNTSLSARSVIRESISRISNTRRDRSRNRSSHRATSRKSAIGRSCSISGTRDSTRVCSDRQGREERQVDEERSRKLPRDLSIYLGCTARVTFTRERRRSERRAIAPDNKLPSVRFSLFILIAEIILGIPRDSRRSTWRVKLIIGASTSPFFRPPSPRRRAVEGGGRRRGRIAGRRGVTVGESRLVIFISN